MSEERINQIAHDLTMLKLEKLLNPNSKVEDLEIFELYKVSCDNFFSYLKNGV